jgi:hypothetical protein
MRTPLFVLAGLVALAAAAAAQTPPPARSPEVLEKVYACRAIPDGAARLACFDAAVSDMKTAESEGRFAAVDQAGVRQIEREAFGFSLPSLPRLAMPRLGGGGAAEPAQPTAELAMTIRAVGRFDGRQSFVMDNGQTWVLIDSASNRLARPGASVTIKRASFGSYLMSVEAGGTALRVRRAQ